MDVSLVTRINPPRSHTAAAGVRRRRIMRRLQPYLYLLPALVTIGVWVYRPLVEVVQLSFFNWNLLPSSPKTFVGLSNYREILALPELGKAVANTLVYIGGLVPLAIVVPVIIAVVTSSLSKRQKSSYRAIIFTPVIMAPVVVTVLWRWILSPYNGFVNTYLIEGLGFEAVSFFGQSLAIFTIIFITGWGLMGFSTLVFSAAISRIDYRYLEAAALEGAAFRQIVRHIVVPLLSPAILFMTMLTVLFASQWTFAHINVLTQYTSFLYITNIYHLLYEFGFQSFNIGWSSAAAVLSFIAFGIIAAGFLWLSERYAFYDS
jgi:multiple sugar transport system permease protein